MTPAETQLRIVVLAPLRYPICQPFAGGLESAIWNEVRYLRNLGHEVSLVAVEGSDYVAGGPSQFVLPAVTWPAGSDPDDVAYPDGYLREALPRLHAALDHIQENSSEFDVVANHCLHPVPLERAATLGVPMVSTLHTPVLVDLAAAYHDSEEPRSRFVAVSAHTAAEWQRAKISSVVLPNAIAAEDWAGGDGGDRLVWFGRLVPEKGAHLAIDAARMLGRQIDIVGRVADRNYVAAEIAPRLGADVRLIGELDRAELARLIGSSACALVTPVWDEPFGLVVPEALTCGTPVAAFHSGGVAETAERAFGIETAPVGDVAALADVVDRLIRRARADPGYRSVIRERAIEQFSMSRRMGVLEGMFRQMALSTAQLTDGVVGARG